MFAFVVEYFDDFLEFGLEGIIVFGLVECYFLKLNSQ